MESVEVILMVDDLPATRAEVADLGGTVRHVLTEQLVVAALPDADTALRLRHARPVDPAAVGPFEQRLLRALDLKRHPPRVRGATPAVRPWDTPGYEPPGHPDDDDQPRRARSTNTPTSVELRGSVAVGIVMVSGPASAWVPVDGALKHVSMAADGTLWGVNAKDNIFRREKNAWTPVAGALKQISVGSAANVWGVNADDKVFRRGIDRWEPMPGRLKHVSAAADGSVWGVNAGDQIFRWNGTGWTSVAGALKQLSVASANTVWGVNAADQIFRWNGSGWTRVAGSLAHVSAAADGSVWGVNAAQGIFRRSGSSWTAVPGLLKQVSVGKADAVWGVNAGDTIYTRGSLALTTAERSTVMAEVMQGLAFLASADPEARVSFEFDWHEVEVDVTAGTGSSYEDREAPWRNAALKQLGFAASRQGSVDYVNSLRTRRKTDWAYVAYFTRYPLAHFAYASNERLVMHYDNDGWGPDAINQVFAHESCHIFGAADEYGDCGCGNSGHSNTPNLNCVNCTTAQVDCLMNANTLSLCGWSRAQIGWSTWRPIGGALIHVSVGADGQVWGCNASHQIFRRDGSAWTRIAGSLRQVSVGRDGQVWGVNADDKIFRWNGAGWTAVSGALRHVSVASDGTVWGVNAGHKIFRFNGSGWTAVAGALKQIAVGSASQVWGVNASDDIFRRSGNAWQQIAGKLKHVSVAADGTVWGVNAGNQIFRRGTSAWERLPGALVQVATGSATRVWGVNGGHDIFQLK